MLFRFTITICSIAFAASTIGPAISQQALNSGTSVSEKYGYVLTVRKWDSPDIPICWEKFAESSTGDRDLVRAAVKDSWEKYSRVRFLGWGECTGSELGVRIAVRDESPQTLKLGILLMAKPRGMTLNFTMAKWVPKNCTNGRDACVRAIAIHEFGHALAFSHEQNRPDRPDRPQDWCNEAAQGANGDYMTAVYDDASIMNYCNEKWAGQGGLSAIDIEALRKVYGA